MTSCDSIALNSLYANKLLILQDKLIKILFIDFIYFVNVTELYPITLPISFKRRTNSDYWSVG